jgi:RNA polymerase sigma-70 factor, ECF subfamily
MAVALPAQGVERRLTPSMADARARSEGKTAATEASSSVGAGVSGEGRTTAESQVVARSILERGHHGLGLHLDRLEQMALDDGPVPGPPSARNDGSRGPPSPPPADEFLRLFNEYERYVASIGSRILGANNGVDDLVQEVFLVIYQEFHKLRELSSVKAWLATIATRVAWRQRGRPWLYSKLSLTQVEELNPIESTDASPELQADLAALLDRLRSMPATLREPWLLRFIDGETLPRIAELCECSQSTVQRRLREAGEVMLGEKAPSSTTG